MTIDGQKFLEAETCKYSQKTNLAVTLQKQT